ncbi:MAG: MFS transporter [Gammaproteobacteria bacterium]
MPNKKLKQIEEYKIYGLCFVLGLISGLPLALTGSTLQAWLAQLDYSPALIGSLSLVGGAHTYKFLYAPVFDRVYLGAFRRGAWIFGIQALLIAWVFLFSQWGLKEMGYWGIFILASILAASSASLDIVIDAYRTEILDPKTRALGSAMAVNGYRIGMLLSGGGALYVAAKLGFERTYQLLALLMLAFMGLSWFLFKEKKLDQPIHPNFFKNLKAAFQDYFEQKQALWILALLILYKLGDAFAGTMSYVFLQKELQVPLEDLGLIMKTFGLLGTLAGVTLGGLWLKRFSLFQVLLLGGLLQALSNLTYLIFYQIHWNKLSLAFVVGLESCCGALSMAAIMSLITGACRPQYAATQYALLSSVAVIPRIYLGPLAGYVVGQYGYAFFFYFSLVLALPGLFILWPFKRRAMAIKNSLIYN